MELTIKHVIELSPDTVALLQTIFGGRAQAETPAPAEGSPAKRASTKKAETPAPAATPEPETVQEPTAEIKPLATTAATEGVTYTTEQVREVAAEFVRAGKQALLKELLGNYSASKLTDLKPEHYADFMNELQLQKTAA